MRSVSAIAALCGLLVAVLLAALCVGSESIAPGTIVSVLLGQPDTVEYTILARIRLPRVILGAAVGGALSLAGVMLQGIFRNPLVEPYTLGISGGAALGVSVCVLLRLSQRVGSWTLPAAGFAGALASVALVSAFMMRRRVTGTRDLVLVGVMISFVCSSAVMLIMAVSRQDDLHAIIFWLMGSLEDPSLLLIKTAAVVSLLSLGVSWLFSLNLNALALGSEEAMHLGVDVEWTRRILFLLAGLVTGVSVSVAGVIGFVGLVVPHFMRLFVGEDHRVLLPSAWLCGAAFLVLCDAVARTVVRPTELPVGVITGILGGSLFIYAMGKGPARGGTR